MDKIIWSGYSQEEKNGIWYSTQARKTITILFTLKEYVCYCCPVIVHVNLPDLDIFAQLIILLFNNDG